MKKLLSILLGLVMIICLAGCNKTILDTTYYFDRGIIHLPDGETVSGKVDRWCDYEGDQLQIVIDGKAYLVHSMNAVLIAE
jgi:hypothetical protein